MKLSRIIELALVKHYGTGEGQREFMCHAVEQLFEEDLITLVQVQDTQEDIFEMMDSIITGYPALVSALCAANYLKVDRASVNIEYTTQLYVWWVYDLKNKGL